MSEKRQRPNGRSKDTPASRDRHDHAREFDDGSWSYLGVPRALVQRLNDHVVIVRFAGRHLGIIGHYRQAHIEAGPFGQLGEARAAWGRMRRELEAFRVSRVQSRRAGTAWPPVGFVGTGWLPQAAHVARCGGCRRRAERRAAAAREWGERANLAASGAGRRWSTIVRRARPVVRSDADPTAAGGLPAEADGAAVVDGSDDAARR